MMKRCSILSVIFILRRTDDHSVSMPCRTTSLRSQIKHASPKPTVCIISPISITTWGSYTIKQNPSSKQALAHP